MAAALLVLGSLAGYASYTASAHWERQSDKPESSYDLPSEREMEDEDSVPDATDREEQTDEDRKTAD